MQAVILGPTRFPYGVSELESGIFRIAGNDRPMLCCMRRVGWVAGIRTIIDSLDKLIRYLM